jgi:hypothetical protein
VLGTNQLASRAARGPFEGSRPAKEMCWPGRFQVKVMFWMDGIYKTNAVALA